MKSCSVFVVFIFIGFLATYGETASAGTDSTTDAYTTPAADATTTSPGGGDNSETTTIVTDAPNGATTTIIDSSATTISSATDGASQSTISSGTDNPTVTGASVTTAAAETGSTVSGEAGTTQSEGSPASSQSGGSAGTTAAGNPPTTAAPAPTCPVKDITYVKTTPATTSWTVTIPASLNCTYFARSADFSKSIKIENPNVNGDGAALVISANGDVIFSSVNSGGGVSTTTAAPDASTKASQISIQVSSSDAEATAGVTLSLVEDTCVDPTVCANGGTCQVIMGQETCTCAPCFIGTTCDIAVDPCATYQLVCKRDGGTCEPDTSVPGTCVAKCVP